MWPPTARIAHAMARSTPGTALRIEARAHVDLDRDAPRVEAVDGEGGDAGEHAGHATRGPVTVEGVNGTESAQGHPRSGVMALLLRRIGTERVSRVTRSHL